MDDVNIDVADATATDSVVSNEPADTSVQDARQGGGEAKADAKPSTLLDDADKDDTPISHPATFPEDWREQMAGGDEKFLAALKRYKTPAAYAKAGFDAQQKIRSGEFKRPLADDATPEEKAAWRKEMGLPENPEDYKIDLGEFVPGEADQPIIEDFTKVAHGLDLPPDHVNKVLQWYYGKQDQMRAELQHADTQYKQDSLVELRTELGNEFRPSMQSVMNLMEGSPALGEALLGRGPDGNIILNNPAVVRELMALANERNPAAGLVPAGTKDTGKAVQSRLAELDKMYATDYEGYKKGGFEAEHEKLLAAQMKMAS